VARYAGRAGEGFICTSGKGLSLYTDDLIPAVKEGAAASGRSFDDIDRMIESIAAYIDAGLNHLVFHGPGHDQRRFLELFERDLEPRLRERAAG
jgi:coenzyme F420-dependent glucose-6-phosphate dehydrogenase